MIVIVQTSLMCYSYTLPILMIEPLVDEETFKYGASES